jgi:hypothetical protein
MRMRRVLVTVVLVLAAFSAFASGSPVAAATQAAPFPKVIPLPNGWRPEGIAVGRGTNFYVGSLRDGSIFHGNLATGQGSVLVTGTAGHMAVGVKVDERNRIWVAGGGGGDATVYDARSGRQLAHFQFTPAGATFVNDAAVTERAVYFTDSVRPFLYAVPLGEDGQLPDPSTVRALPLSGGLGDPAGFNNGIVTTPDGRRLLVVQSNSGNLFEFDPRTGASRQVDLGGASLLHGDGLARRGDTLYAVQNAFSKVAVVRLDDEDGAISGRVVRTITDPALDVPSTAALFGPFLYAVNARFSTPPTPTTHYEVIRLRA